MPLRNSLHRRNHKERSQLAHRARLGILEKHKDYVKRAKDYHSKQDKLNRLKQKAAEKNKDEFYFAMKNQSTKGGVHVADRGNVALPQDIVKVLKSQDENYVRTMRSAGLKKIDKLKAQLTAMADLLTPDAEDALEPEEIETLQNAGILPKSKGKRRAAQRIVFVEDVEEAKQYANSAKKRSAPSPLDEATADATSPSDLGWKVPTSKKARRTFVEDDEAEYDEDSDAVLATDQRGTRTRLLKELSARLFRDTQLRYAEREFEMQRQLMGKGARRKIAGVERADGAESDEEDEDEIDARRGKRRAPAQKFVDAKTYKPRVYKWRLERKGK
ncbi:hypothetical protein MKEN_01291000 [Mycena kentingensis (nom. inval.)]|nr:hypothetical protein MKEN_01291000 [Mycena kentingensis (nom. inval.)]